MGTTAGSDLAHVPYSDTYDFDDWLPRGSPLLAARTVNLRPSLSPPPSIPLPAKSNAGDAMLVAVLGGGRNPDIAATAAVETLPSDPDEIDSQMSDDTESLASQDSDCRVRDGHSAVPEGGRERDGGEEAQGMGQERDMDTPAGTAAAVTITATSSQRPRADSVFDLKSLAAGALAFTTSTPTVAMDVVTAGPTPPVTENDVGIQERRQPGTTPAAITIRNDVPYPEDRPAAPVGPAAYASPYSPSSLCSPRDPNFPSLARMEIRSPTLSIAGSSTKGELPPIQKNSPRSDTSGQTPLPSIKAQLETIRQLEEHAIGRDGSMMHPAFPHSPPGTFPPMAIPRHQGSPPISPAETFQRGLPSPRHPQPIGPSGQQPLAPAPPSSSPSYSNSYFQQHRQQHQNHHSFVNGSSHPPRTEGGPGEAQAAGDRMSIDGLTTATGWFVCPYDNCNAAPFQTQYLLNSHANVHSSVRPHFCPVKGCPRSEGGKGFKRKNEMIRHGLVHDSPGYVCPFCPDREHKYPRPDNLQRHVRVHHVDKDKDDPLLRDVLSQRPDGPSRGRRRRGPFECR